MTCWLRVMSSRAECHTGKVVVRNACPFKRTSFRHRRAAPNNSLFVMLCVRQSCLLIVVSLVNVVVLKFACFAQNPPRSDPAQQFDVVIKGGLVYDGTGEQ